MTGLKMQKQVTVPDGRNTGEIIACLMTQRDFKQGAGKETVVEITIRPDHKAAKGVEVLNLTVSYKPILNGLSSLSALLERLGKLPDNNQEWEPNSLVGTRVSFEARADPETHFTNVVKQSIKAI